MQARRAGNAERRNRTTFPSRPPPMAERRTVCRRPLSAMRAMRSSRPSALLPVLCRPPMTTHRSCSARNRQPVTGGCCRT
jgi:hypothetical protein